MEATVTLIVQIALGILLGYLLIEHRQRLGSWVVVFVKAALVVLAVSLLVIAAGHLSETVESKFPVVPATLGAISDKLLILVFAIPVLGVIALGAYGLCIVLRRLAGRWFEIRATSGTLIFLAVVGVLLAWPLDLYMRWSTPYGAFYEKIDTWSRANGFADLFGSLLSSSLTLWPWAIIGIGTKLGGDFFAAEATRSEELDES